MYIVIAHPADPISTSMGGAVRWAVNLATSLSTLGHSVMFIGCNNSNVKEVHLPYTFYPILTGSCEWAQYIKQLFRKIPFIDINKDAVIVTHRFDIMTIFVLFKPNNPKILVSTGPLYAAKSLWPTWFPLIKELYQILERYVLPRLEIIGVMDETTNKRYKEMRFLCDDICMWTWTSVDINRFKPLNYSEDPDPIDSNQFNNKIKVAYAGRLDKVKNLDFLLRSYRHVEEKNQSTELILFGDGPEMSNLQNLSKFLNIRTIHFAGAFPAKTMPEVLNSVDIVVLPAIGGEGSPTILKEALACGKPIVTMDVGDVNKFLTNPLAGRIVIQEDEEIMADAILDMVTLIKNKREQVKEACRSLSLEYSLENFGHHWEQLITLAIARKKSG